MDVIEAIKARRAYRSLEAIGDTDKLIQDFANLAQLAPSCMNNQPWKFVFVTDENQLQNLFTTLTPGNKWVEKTSLIIAVVSEPNDDCIIGDRQYYLFDTGMATAFIILRATELGFIAHPIVGFNEKKAKEILNIPIEMRLITLVIVGKRSKEINPVLSEPMKLGEKQRPPRKDFKEFIFLNKFSRKVGESDG